MINKEEILKELRLALTHWENTYHEAIEDDYNEYKIIYDNDCIYGFCHYFKIRTSNIELYDLLLELFKDYEYKYLFDFNSNIEADYVGRYWYNTYASRCVISDLLPRIENLRRTIKRLENE